MGTILFPQILILQIFEMILPINPSKKRDLLHAYNRKVDERARREEFVALSAARIRSRQSALHQPLNRDVSTFADRGIR